MSAAVILQLVMGLMQAAPQLLQLYQQVANGKQASAADVQAIIAKCGIDRAVFAAALAAAEQSAGVAAKTAPTGSQSASGVILPPSGV